MRPASTAKPSTRSLIKAPSRNLSHCFTPKIQFNLSHATAASLIGVALALSTGCQAFDGTKGGKVPTPPSRPTTVIDGSNTGRPPAVVATEGSPAQIKLAPSPKKEVPRSVDRTKAATPAPMLSPAEIAVNAGKALESQGKYAEALAAFDRAISDNPLLISAYLGSGELLRNQGDYSAAEKRYQRACQVDPQNFDAQYQHGLTLQLLNRWPDAVGAYLRALAIKPEDFQANLNVATAYLQLGEPERALPFGQRAAASDPGSGPARNNLGRVYAALVRHGEAIVEYQQAAELMPLTAPLLLNLANSLGKESRHEEAVNVLNQLILTEPTPAAYERLGASLFKLRRYDAAMAAFKTSLEIDANHFPALNGLGVCLLNQYEFAGQSDDIARIEAVRALRRSLQLQPNQPAILNLITRYQ